MTKSKTFEINWLSSAGSALAAITSAVLLSTLGAAGTLFGAALGSLVITVGGSIYIQTFQKTKAFVAGAGARSSSPNGVTNNADRRSAGAPSTAPDRPPKKPLGQRLRELPWKRIAGLTVGLFIATMAIILVFELSTGRPVSSYTGGSNETDTGTTFSELKPAGDDSDNGQSDEESPAEELTPSEEKPTQAQPADPPAEEKPADPPANEKPADPPAQEKPADPPANEKQPADQAQQPADQGQQSDG